MGNLGGMKYLVILGLGASALAAPLSSIVNEEPVLSIRDLSDAQIRGFGHFRSKRSLRSSSSPLLPHNIKHLQKRADKPDKSDKPRPARRAFSQKNLSRTKSTVRFPSPDKLASYSPASTPRRPLTHSTSLKSQKSLMSLYSPFSRDDSPWRHHDDSPRQSRSPMRNLDRQATSRGSSPWGDGGGAVYGHHSSSSHSILGFDPSESKSESKSQLSSPRSSSSLHSSDSHPLLRVPSHKSFSERTDASPMGPVTPGGRTPRRGGSTPLTPSTPWQKSG